MPHSSVHAYLEYTGMLDYWSGNGRRWDDDAACVFASYDVDSTMAQLISQWLADDGDMTEKEAWEVVTDEEIRTAIVEALSQAERTRLAENAVCGLALELASDVGHSYGDETCTCECCSQFRPCLSELPQAILLLTLETGDDA